MRSRIAITMLAFLAGAPFAHAALPPLVPRAQLFGEPREESPAISPDGRWLAWAKRDTSGVVNLWVRGLDRDTAWQVTRDARRGVHYGTWTPRSDRLLFMDDGDGDENNHVFSVEIATGRTRDLTPFVGARAEGIHLDARHPDAMLVGLNVRDPRVFDLYRVDLETGAVTLDARNPGDVLEWIPGPDLHGRACMALRAGDVATVLRVRDRADGPWRDLVVWSMREAGFDRSPKILAVLDDSTLLAQVWAGSNTSRLATMSARDGRILATLAHDARGDLWQTYTGANDEVRLWHGPGRKLPVAVGIEYLKPEWRVLDPAYRADFDALARLAAGETFIPVCADSAGRRWVVQVSSDRNPGRYVLWDRAKRRATPLFDTRPDLRRSSLAPTKPLVIRARDGREIPCYLTLPVGVAPAKLPLVAYVHGGPWFRDGWAFDPALQLLANRGYAVLQVNFRGSTGFGLDHLNAGDGQFGPGAVLQDVLDAIAWTTARGIADPARIGIMGYSFGGYATLAGLAFAPEVFACGVDVVGPSDLAVLFDTFPPYWGPRRQRWIDRMGDVQRDAALNRRLSPLYHVDAMRAPLMIGHGANDPRVKLGNSELIVNALRARGVGVDFIVYPDEGHGFGRAENNLDFFGRIEEFLAKHLGGRAEPWREVPGSTASVR